MIAFEIFTFNWSPVVLLLGLLLFWFHLHLTNYKITFKTILFTAGLLLAETSLALPMGPAANQPLFSLHMARHVILLMVAPPLLVAGLPEKLVRRFTEDHKFRSVLTVLLNPVLTWVLGVGIMWFWHAPFVFNGMMMYEGTGWMHYFLKASESLSLLLIGLLFCSPVLFPMPEFRLPDLQGIIYLFLACSACTVLGILITFASPGLYQTAFAGGASTVWGLTEQTDQQLGGLLMWVPGCMLYVSGAMVLLVRWFSKKEPMYQTASKQTSNLKRKA